MTMLKRLIFLILFFTAIPTEASPSGSDATESLLSELTSAGFVWPPDDSRARVILTFSDGTARNVAPAEAAAFLRHLSVGWVTSAEGTSGDIGYGTYSAGDCLGGVYVAVLYKGARPAVTIQDSPVAIPAEPVSCGRQTVPTSIGVLTGSASTEAFVRMACVQQPSGLQGEIASFWLSGGPECHRNDFSRFEITGRVGIVYVDSCWWDCFSVDIAFGAPRPSLRAGAAEPDPLARAVIQIG